MDTGLTDEQRQLEEQCIRLLEKEWPLDQARKVLGPGGDGHSPALWRTISDNGWLALPFSEAVGGVGGGLIELGLLYRAAGYRLVPSSLYSTLFAGLLIERLCGTDDARKVLTPVFAGDALMTLAYAEPQSSDDPRYWSATANRVGDQWRLSGEKVFVAMADLSEIVLVLAKARAGSETLGWGLFRLAGTIPMRMARQATFGSERLFRIALDDVTLPQSALLGGTEALSTTLDAFLAVREIASALQCMEMVGGIQSVLDRTVAYVKERQVLGRSVGSNQSVQHMLANRWIYLNGARVAALHALFRVAHGMPAKREVAIARLALGKCYGDTTVVAHQLWGAMGYARETGLYLWSERAKVADAWLGTRHHHRSALLEAMAI